MIVPRIILLAAGLTACGVTPPSNSVEKDKDPETVVSQQVDFATLDQNTDDLLTAREASVIRDLGENFARLDVDGNKLLSRGEYGRWHRAGKPQDSKPADPATRPSGSAGAQHMPKE